MTLKDLLEKNAVERPDAVFLSYDDEAFSYAELNETVNRVGNGFRALGVEKGDKVCLLLTNVPEFIYAWFGCAKIGAVCGPINPACQADEVEYILNLSDAKVLVTEMPMLPLVQKIRGACPTLRHVLIVGAEEPDGCKGFRVLIDESPDETPAVDLKGEDEASLIYTSGTTGNPKGVVLTHANYIADTEMIVKHVGMTPEDKFMCILPLFHVNGQVVTTLAPMMAGGGITLVRRFSASAFFDIVETHRPTAFSAVPTIYAMLLNTPGLESRDLSSLRFCICGAAPMPVEVFNKFEEAFNAKILEGFGLSEGTCASSVNPIDGRRKVGSIGIPLPGQEMNIVDDAGNPLPAGEVGEITVKGPNVMKGYYKNPEATAQTLRNGWLHTGDLGKKDEDGYYYIVGRKKEMIIRGGENIYPREIEEVLYKHPDVLEAAVVGAPDKVYGEEVKAFVAPKPGSSPSKEALEAWCLERLAKYKCPKLWEFRESLPKTATGKIQKRKLVENSAWTADAKE